MAIRLVAGDEQGFRISWLNADGTAYDATGHTCTFRYSSGWGAATEAAGSNEGSGKFSVRISDIPEGPFRYEWTLADGSGNEITTSKAVEAIVRARVAAIA